MRSTTSNTRLTGERLSYLIDLLILLGLCLLFFWRVLTPRVVDRWIFEPGDFAIQYYFPSSYLSQRLTSGSVPLWQDYAFAGHPFAADIQNGAFYPPRLLNVLLHPGVQLTYRGLELEVFFHFLLIISGCYLLARRLIGNRYGGLLAAIIFTFGGYLTSYPPLQMNFLESQAWLPLILLFWEIAATRWSQSRSLSAESWAIAAGLLWGVSILGGSAQSSVIMFYGVLAFAFFRLLSIGKATWRKTLTMLGFVASYVLVGCGVAAIQLLPTVEMLPLSMRASIGFEEAGRGFTPYDLLQLLYPAVGGQFQALYVGVLAIGLTTLAVLVVRRDPRTSANTQRTIAFWGWSGLVALLLSFGKHTSLFAIPYLLAPGWGLFRQQERNVVWSTLAVALLAGYGMAWLCDRWKTGSADALDVGESASDLALQRRMLWAYAIATAVVGVLALVFFVGYQAGKDNFWGFATASLMMTLLLLLAIITLSTRRPALLIVLVVIDLFTVNSGRFAGPYPNSSNLGLDHPALAIILAEKAQTNEIFRVANEDVLPPNFGAKVGLEDVNGASPLVVEAFYRWKERVPVERVWHLLGVKYVITRRQQLAVAADRLWEGQIADGTPVFLYRISQPGPRAWLTTGAIVQPDVEQALTQAASPDFDSTPSIVLPATPTGNSETGDCEGAITWKQREPEYFALEVDADRSCFLVLGELVYPGWFAAVDGVPTPIMQADGIFRAISLPNGLHEVTFAFRPRSFFAGGLLTALTVLLVMLWFVAVRFISPDAKAHHVNIHPSDEQHS